MSVLRIERHVPDVHGTIERARKECLKFRSLWEGDDEKGRFVIRTHFGTLEGSYSVAGNLATFVIEQKPRFLPGALIERVLDEFLRAG